MSDHVPTTPINPGITLRSAVHVFQYIATEGMEGFQEYLLESGMAPKVSRETMRHNFEVLAKAAQEYAEEYESVTADPMGEILNTLRKLGI